MIHYINNFKKHSDLITKKTELTINTFKLIYNANINITEEFINDSWRLTIKVDI